MSKNDPWANQEKRIKLISYSLELYLENISDGMLMKNEMEVIETHEHTIIGGIGHIILPSLSTPIGSIIGKLFGKSPKSKEKEIEEYVNKKIEEAIEEAIEKAAKEISERVETALESQKNNLNSPKTEKADSVIIEHFLEQQNHLFKFIKSQSVVASKLDDSLLMNKLTEELSIIIDSYSRINSVLFKSLIFTSSKYEGHNEPQTFINEAEIERLLIENKVNEALEVSLKYFKLSNNTEGVTNIILLLSQQRKLDSEKRMSIVTHEFYLREITRISKTLLELISLEKKQASR